MLCDPQLINFWYSCYVCIKYPCRTCVSAKKVDSPQLCELEGVSHTLLNDSAGEHNYRNTCTMSCKSSIMTCFKHLYFIETVPESLSQHCGTFRDYKMGLFYYTLLYCTYNVSTIILSKLFIMKRDYWWLQMYLQFMFATLFIGDIDHTWSPSSTVASYRWCFTVGVCVSSKATADCSGKNRYLMGAGESMIKHHLHMEPLTQGTSPVRNEAP